MKPPIEHEDNCDDKDHSQVAYIVDRPAYYWFDPETEIYHRGEDDDPQSFYDPRLVCQSCFAEVLNFEEKVTIR